MLGQAAEGRQIFKGDLLILGPDLLPPNADTMKRDLQKMLNPHSSSSAKGGLAHRHRGHAVSQKQLKAEASKHKGRAWRFSLAAYCVLLLKVREGKCKTALFGASANHSCIAIQEQSWLCVSEVPRHDSNCLYIKRHCFLPSPPNYLYLRCVCLWEVMQDGKGSTKSDSLLPQWLQLPSLETQSPCNISWCLNQESFMESFSKVHCTAVTSACNRCKPFLCSRIALIFSTVSTISEVCF